MKNLIDSILFSYSQIFFSNRLWFGAIVLLSTFITPTIGLVSLYSILVTNLIAYGLNFDKEKIRSGFYGFNGILFGSAVAFYFEVNLFLFVLLTIFIIICFLFTAFLENYFQVVFNLPGLSLPFVLSTYLFIIFSSNYSLQIPEKYFAIEIFKSNLFTKFIADYFYSFSFIIYQPQITTGIILFIAVLFFSRVLISLSVFAFILNSIFLWMLLPEQYENLIIVTGFNSILTAFALGGSLIISSRKNLILVVISTLLVVIFSIIIAKLFQGTKFPILALPFNIIVLSTLYSLRFRQDSSGMVLLYFAPGSPEENFYYHNNKMQRFGKHKNVVAELPFYGKWLVSQAFNGKHTHKNNWKYAWDFIVVDENKKEFLNDGTKVEDYFCNDLPIISSSDGVVEKIENDISDNKIGEVDLTNNWGNTIVINNGQGLFSSISHIKNKSIELKTGEKINIGETVAKCGNSGRSPTPHIHFQFQTSNKIGAETHKYPISSFIEYENDNPNLKTFDFPTEGNIVENIQTTEEMVNAYNFKLGDTIVFNCITENKNYFEQWETKIDFSNNFYLESSVGDKAYFFKSNKIFYFTNYYGKKNSALYYFYLINLQVPLGFQENLSWSENYSPSQIKINYLKYLLELFLPIKNLIISKGDYLLKQKNDLDKTIVLECNINTNTKNIFSFLNENYFGETHISINGKITGFSITKNNKILFKTLRKD